MLNARSAVWTHSLVAWTVADWAMQEDNVWNSLKILQHQHVINRTTIMHVNLDHLYVRIFFAGYNFRRSYSAEKSEIHCPCENSHYTVYCNLPKIGPPSKIRPPPFFDWSCCKGCFSLESTPTHMCRTTWYYIKQKGPKKQHCARGGTDKTAFAVIA